MVRLTAILGKYIPSWYAINDSPSKRFFKRHNLYKITQYYYGRNRNCYKVSISKFLKNTEYENRDRALKKLAFRDLYSQRIVAACREHDFPYHIFISSLSQAGVDLDRYSLSCLAIWEPRTFKALIELTKEFEYCNPINPMKERIKPVSVISRGKLDKLNLDINQLISSEKESKLS